MFDIQPLTATQRREEIFTILEEFTRNTDENQLEDATDGILDQYDVYGNAGIPADCVTAAEHAWDFVLRHLPAVAMRLTTADRLPAEDAVIVIAWALHRKQAPLASHLRELNLRVEEFLVDLWIRVMHSRGTLRINA